MRETASKLLNCFAVSVMFIIIAFCFSAKAYAGKPVYYDGWSDQFRVTVTWEVENDYKDEGNGFGVYYYKPANGCYYKADTGQYSFVRNINKAAKEKGTRSCTFDLQGPPCRIYMQANGRAMNKVQFYLKKVEVEPIHPRPGTGLPAKFTLWEGKFGCSVATTFTNTIACDLFLDRGKPEFSNWYDPSSHREAVFGDDKVNETYNYYGRGCTAPYIYCKDSDGNYCDQYGVAWPLYDYNLSSKSGGKVTINWKSLQKKIKKAYPKAKFVEIQYSTNRRFKKSKTITKKVRIKDLKRKTVIRHLKKKRTYYFRARLIRGKKHLTRWSGTIKIKTKR